MTRVRTPEPDGFPEYWNVWRPHRRKNDGRGDARAAYAKAILRGHHPDDILEAAQHYIATMKDAERQYIPLAATWLNREPFDDILADKADAERKATDIAERRNNGAARVASAHSISPMGKRTKDDCDLNGGEYPDWLKAELARTRVAG